MMSLQNTSMWMDVFFEPVYINIFMVRHIIDFHSLCLVSFDCS